MPLFHVLINLIQSLAYALSCDDAFECERQVIFTSNVDCDGYFSCYKATIQASSSLDCYGGYSCYQAQAITYSGISSVECFGLMSCAQISNIYGSTNSDILCYGELSCMGSGIYSVQEQYNVMVIVHVLIVQL